MSSVLTNRLKTWRDDRAFNESLRNGLKEFLKKEKGAISVAGYLVAEESRKVGRLTVLLVIETAVLTVLTIVLAWLTWLLLYPGQP